MPGSTLTSISTAGISLTSGENPFTIATGGGISVASGAYALTGAGTTVFTIANYGQVTAAASNSAGIGLTGGGTVRNQISFTPSSTIIGTIAGGAAGVSISGGTGSIKNDGLIEATASGSVGVSLSTGGYVYDFGNFFAGGTILTTGSIVGAMDGIAVSGGAGTIRDDAVIEGTGSNSAGVSLSAGGFVGVIGANSYGGSIVGGAYGVAISGGTGGVTNGWLIQATAATGFGVSLSAGGSVYNVGTGFGPGSFHIGDLVGGTSGASVLIAGGAGTVTNYGVIGVPFRTNPGGAASAIGVSLNSGGFVLNGDVSSPALTGTIEATQTAIYARGGPTTVANYGSIIGGAAGVILPAGYANQLRLAGGSTIVGTVDGGNPVDASIRSSLVLGVQASTARNFGRSSVGTLAGLGETVTNFSNITFASANSWSLSGNVSGIAGGQTFSGFASNDTLDIGGVINETISGFAANTLTLGGGATIDVIFAGNFTAGDFQVSNDPSGGTFINTTSDANRLACFARGTHILTEMGEVAVEDLRPGDRVVRGLGWKSAPVVWIGSRHVRAADHSDSRTVAPVLIRPSAFGPNVPHAPLRLSPDHAVFVDGVLVPVGLLANGHSIVREDAVDVTYFHVELPEHDVLLAEGLPCESYLACGDRHAFDHGRGAIGARVSVAPSVRWETGACARLVRHGVELDRIRDRLTARAGMLAEA